MPKMHGSGLARSSKRIEERGATLRLTRKAPYKVKSDPEALVAFFHSLGFAVSPERVDAIERNGWTRSPEYPALRLHDADDHLLAVDVTRPQPHHLAGP